MVCIDRIDGARTVNALKGGDWLFRRFIETDLSPAAEVRGAGDG